MDASFEASIAGLEEELRKLPPPDLEPKDFPLEPPKLEAVYSNPATRCKDGLSSGW